MADIFDEIDEELKTRPDAGPVDALWQICDCRRRRRGSWCWRVAGLFGLDKSQAEAAADAYHQALAAEDAVSA